MKCTVVEARNCWTILLEVLVLFYYDLKDLILMVTSYILQMSVFIILTVKRFSELQHKFWN